MNNNNIIGKIHDSMYQQMEKSGSENIEKVYATHYLSPAKIIIIENQ